MADILTFFLSVALFTRISTCFNLADFDSFDVNRCEESCETGIQQSIACKRGCRFFSLINYINEHPNLNDTLQACKSACDEAHFMAECRSSCAIGCQNQLPLTERYRQSMEALRDPMDYYVSPFLYMNKLYSNMVEKVHNQVSVSWSFFVQSDRGALIVVRSEPSIHFSDWNPNLGESKTSNYIETNLAENDNSATPNLKNSQIHVEGRSLDISLSGEESSSSDWLDCVARKTGLPRLFLSVLLIGCSVSIIWLCVATSISSVDQKTIHGTEKLSIYGDLDYLHSIDDGEKAYLVKTRAQDFDMQAAPLPIKIKIETV